MNEPLGCDGNVSNLLTNIYRCADKSSWYSKVIEAYDRTRSRYPSQLIARVQEITQLQPGKRILEIGAGPGIATVELAKLGLEIVAIEPNLAACQLAQRKCAKYPSVEFINSTFEEWELTRDKFDLVVATTSFHWVTPEIRNLKTASALKENGYLVLLWNTPPQPSPEIQAKLVPVYQRYASELTQPESIASHQQNIAKFGQEMIDSGYYQDLIVEQIVSQVSYTVDEYLTLLTTLSPYIRLESSRRDTLLAELKEVLQLNCGDCLELSYLSMFQAARKVK